LVGQTLTMHPSKLALPKEVIDVLLKEGITKLRPSQQKALKAGLLKGKNLLVCTPTASGKTLIAEMAAAKSIIEEHGKAIYIVPLKALASEKYKSFTQKYGHLFRVGLSIGDKDKADAYLADYDLIICTSEKLDSLLRHKAPWIHDVRVVIADEIHLLNDPGRGPTLEVVLTLLQSLKLQLIGLSATIGNPKVLSKWMQATLVEDTWRPVELHQGIYYQGSVHFHKR